MDDGSYYQDDVGDPEGNVSLPYAGSAREVVRSWTVQAVGRRPLDHAERDMIQGSLRYDRRVWPMHQIAKYRPTWLYEDTHRLSDAQREVVANARAVHFLQLSKLFTLYEFSPDAVTRKLKAMINCPPTLALFHHPRAEVRPCRQVFFCPFCLGRVVKKVFAQIPRPSESTPTCYFQATAEITSINEETGQEISACEAKSILNVSLRQFREKLNASGGITTFSVGPFVGAFPVWANDEMKHQDQYGFTYRASIIAEVPDTIQGIQDTWESCTQPVDERDLIAVTTENAIEASESSLRWMIFGQQRFIGTPESCFIPGAFAYQPWTIANSAQWLSAMYQLRNMRSYELWGTWRRKENSIRPSAKKLYFKKNFDMRAIHIARKRRNRTIVLNLAKRAIADDRMQQINASIQTLGLTERIRGHGHVRTKRILAGSGVNVSVREAKKLAEQYKSPSES